MRDGQQDALGRVGRVTIACGRLVLGDDDRAVGGPGVIHEEAPIARIERMERQSEQPLFAA